MTSNADHHHYLGRSNAARRQAGYAGLRAVLRMRHPLVLQLPSWSLQFSVGEKTAASLVGSF